MFSVKRMNLFSDIGHRDCFEPASNVSVLPWVVQPDCSPAWIDLSHDCLCQASMDDGSLGSADDTEEIISPPKSRTTSQGAPSPMPPSRDQVEIVTFFHSIGSPPNTIDVYWSFGFITLWSFFFSLIFSLLGNMDHMLLQLHLMYLQCHHLLVCILYT